MPRLPDGSDGHPCHPRDPADAWELIRVRTEVELHLRDPRLYQGGVTDLQEVFEACIAAIEEVFGGGDYLSYVVDHWLQDRRALERAEKEAADERRTQEGLAAGRLVACPDCGGAYRAGVGLSSHRRHKHGVAP